MKRPHILLSVDPKCMTQTFVGCSTNLFREGSGIDVILALIMKHLKDDLHSYLHSYSEFQINSSFGLKFKVFWRIRSPFVSGNDKDE